MILREVTLENFGLFRDKVSLDLAPRRRNGIQRPVILVGGRNGAGKTTILEAIRLALYGKKALGSRVAQDEYEDYLRSRIHRPVDAAAPPAVASVGLTFDYADEGRVHTYRVRRSWRARGRSVVESLVVERDGELLSDIPREEWHFFLDDLIPSGVSQLFFFDGEKIQEMAEGGADETHLADAIRGLLGIDLVSRLRTDLGLFIARRSRNPGDRIVEDLERVTRDLEVLNEQLQGMQEEVAHLATRRESEARAAEHARHRFVAEGGEVAAKRASLEVELSQVNERIAKRQQELRDLANGPLAFAVAPRLTRSLLAVLNEAAEGFDPTTKRAFAAQLRSAIKLWKGKGRLPGAPNRSAKWQSEHWKDLSAFIRYWGDLDPHSITKGESFGIAERKVLCERLQHAERSVRPRLETIADALERAAARRHELEAKLIKADAAASNLLLDELQLAEQRLGAVTATLTLREEELAKLRGQRVTLEREQQRILDVQSRSNQDERTSRIAVGAMAALGEYEDRLLHAKLGIVRQEFLRCFRQLVRKADFVADVRIEPSTFAVTLLSENGNEMPKSALSAGEKQIYATAMLWALARASGRPLPMLIDTPLARLDSVHREMLLTRYFPAASHQVVLLSTDTEIDEPALKTLAPAISHTIRLDYQSDVGASRVEADYFWSQTAKEEYALL